MGLDRSTSDSSLWRAVVHLNSCFKGFRLWKCGTMYYCHLNINCGVVWSPLGYLSNDGYCFKFCFRFLWQVCFASGLQQFVPIDYSGIQHLLYHSAATVVRSTEKGRGLLALTYGLHYTVWTSEYFLLISSLRNCSFPLCFFLSPFTHKKWFLFKDVSY